MFAPIVDETGDESEAPIQLFSDDVSEYTGNVLSLPQIMNPRGMLCYGITFILLLVCIGLKGIYNEDNRPEWFPADLHFMAPTHSGGIV